MTPALTRRRFLAISAATLAAPAIAAQATPHSWTGRAFGSDVSLQLYGPRDQAVPMLERVIMQLRHIELLFSLYDPTSHLSRLNRAGILGTPAPEFLELMHLCTRMHAATNGVFDPTIQPLWQALAKDEDITQARSAIGWDRVRISPDAIILSWGQALTLNGIAQGFATDLVRATLTQNGFDKALINIGEYSALGGPFTLGLSDPVHGHLGTRHLHNGAVATSSATAMILANAQPHIQHPTALTAAHWSTVSVKSDQAAVADAASTAFCLMSRAQIRQTLDLLPAGTQATLISHNGDIETLG